MAGKTLGRWTLVVHGGAGAMRSMGAVKEDAYRAGLVASLRVGGALLAAGGSAKDAAVAAVVAMERSGAFNAGRGSCLNEKGKFEADAAVMNGADLSIGAVGAVPGVVNGVELAERIRSDSPHCLLAGVEALEFARKQAGFQLELAQPSADRMARWETLKKQRQNVVQSAEALTDLGGTHDDGDTVGAVALDNHGGLAVAVSTGGLWLKTSGRVGDSPLPGAGYWAERDLIACCATGTGEFIIRAGLCADVRARRQAGASVAAATEGALEALTERFGVGKAGIISVGPNGDVSMPFHTTGMGRGVFRWDDPEPTVAVWPEES